MQRSAIAILILICWCTLAAAQSRRVPQGQALTASVPERSAQELFDEANGYAKAKYTEYQDKKIGYSETLRKQTQLEQRQLAAKNALMLSKRSSLAGDDLYYLGMLHWIAENLDGTAEALSSYLAAEAAADKAQTARSVLTIVAAKQKRYADAEKTLDDYKKTTPAKASDVARMEAEIAKAYLAEKRFREAGPHADEAYAAIKKVLDETANRSRVADEYLDDGMLVFEARSRSNYRDQADAVLQDMTATAGVLNSPSLYYYAVDKLIGYMIETGRKPLAMDTLSQTFARIPKDLSDKSSQTEVIQKLRKREKQYALLGEPTPELESVDQWFPGSAVSLASLKGKVVLLDFWATWCAPCLEAFPAIKEWREEHTDEGLVVIGITRYYGTAQGIPADNASETAFIKRFAADHGLGYDMAIIKDTNTQRSFAATVLPTTVLIDRKGIIRFIDSGTSSSRLEEIRENIVKLLAEK